MDNARIDAVLAPDYLAGLTTISIDEVRSRRSECQAVEVSLSYLRRMVQGRLDIVLAELHRRQEGAPAEDLEGLVARLPEILSEHVHAPGNGRLSAFLAPGDEVFEPELERRLDEIADADCLATLSELDDADMQRLVDELTGLERHVSDQRRAVHERIDALQEELVRRYKTGEATVDSLLK